MGVILFILFFILFLLSKKMSLVYTTTEAIEDYVTCLRGTYTTGK